MERRWTGWKKSATNSIKAYRGPHLELVAGDQHAKDDDWRPRRRCGCSHDARHWPRNPGLADRAVECRRATHDDARHILREAGRCVARVAAAFQWRAVPPD